MASFLENKLRDAIGKGLGAQLLTGTLERTAPAASSALDDYGDPVETATATWPVRGFDDDYDAAYRARAGIPESDVKVCVIGSGLPTEPRKDDVITLSARGAQTRYRVRAVRSDPARALWECQAYVEGAP